MRAIWRGLLVVMMSAWMIAGCVAIVAHQQFGVGTSAELDSTLAHAGFWIAGSLAWLKYG